ncbi:MAG: response regulator [bacterium]|nr:response regulator [bacterium]
MESERFRPFMSFLSAGLDARSTDPMTLRRVRIVNILALAALVLAVPFTFLAWKLGNPLMVAALLLAMPVCLGNIYWLRRHLRPELAAHVTILIGYLMTILGNLATANLADPSFGWFYLLSMAAILTVGPRTGWIWICLFLTTAIIFWMLPAGLEVPGLAAQSSSEIRSLLHRLTAILTIGLLTTVAVTFRRQAERSLQNEIAVRKKAEQEARTADRIKSQFLANVSHEIRTPMNGVIGMTDLLLKAPLPTQQHRQVEAINNSAETLLAVVNDLLDFSKMEAGKLALYVMDFRLRDLLEKVVALLAPRAEEKGLDLRLVISDELPEDLFGDSQRLRQVLLNLLGNAIRFTPRGSVAVSVERQDRADGDLWVRFVVRDTGIGISRQDQARLFAPFSQAESTSARRFGGTGLGLAISRSLVEMMGGEIGVASTRGVGSTFWFRLPLWQTLEESPAGGPTAVEKPGTPGSGLPREERADYRILVVDDDAINRLVAESQLKDLGFVVEAVEGGVQALEAIERLSYDVILMDCQMPELDGYETTRRIREQEPAEEHTLVIAVTAHAMKGERERCLAAGMDDYVSKPLRGEDLLAALARWLSPDGSRHGEWVGTSSREEVLESKPLESKPLAAIRKLGRKTGRDLVGEMIGIYRREGPERLEGMRRALADDDADQLAVIAHSMGGSAVYLGASTLAKQCRELTELARQGNLDGCESRLQAVEAEHQRVLAELDRETANSPR